MISTLQIHHETYLMSQSISYHLTDVHTPFTQVSWRTPKHGVSVSNLEKLAITYYVFTWMCNYDTTHMFRGWIFLLCFIMWFIPNKYNSAPILPIKIQGKIYMSNIFFSMSIQYYNFPNLLMIKIKHSSIVYLLLFYLWNDRTDSIWVCVKQFLRSTMV